MKRKLTAKESKEVLSLTYNDINMELMKSYFAARGDEKEPRFNTFDTFTLPKNAWYNEDAIETTIGRYLVNFFVLPVPFLKKYHYQNTVLTAKEIGNIENKLADMLLNDELTVKEFGTYFDNGEWISLGTSYFLVPSMDYNMNQPIASVIKKRDELFDKYSDEIKAGDPHADNIISDELLKDAAADLKKSGNESYDFYESGEFSFDNNYKKSSIMSGAILDPYTNKMHILKSNYVDGVDQKDFPYFANLTILGGYSRGIETQLGGYNTKKINNSMQGIMLGEPGSDCGTTNFINTVIPEKIKNMFLYRYILDNGKLVLITNDNINNYVGKPVKLRSPMTCKADGYICNKCAGELFYKLGVKNAGFLTSALTGSLLNLSLKKFHDATVTYNTIKVEDYIKAR